MQPIIPQIQHRREEPEWFSRKEASRYLTRIGCPVSPSTLAKLAANGNAGKGPPYTRIRWSLTHYKREDLDAWAETQKVRVE